MSRAIFGRVVAAACASAMMCGPAVAFQVFKVGGDADCPYPSIQAAVDAAAATPGADYVWLAMNRTYIGENVQVSDPDGVIVVGGLTDCDDVDVDTATTTVSGAGNDGSAVFTIRGHSSVKLQNLFITGAARSGDADGGAVDFDGYGDLEVELSSITLNSSGYGAGLNAYGDGGHLDVVLEDNTLVLSNTAQTSGGGVRIEGDTRLYVQAPQTLIAFNEASGGYGGGIEVIAPAVALISSPGYNGLGVIYDNSAQYGGGLAIIDSVRSEIAIAKIATSDPSNPVAIEGNFASRTGGGVYLLGTAYDGAFAPYHAPVFCADDFRIVDNAAPEGSAIYADKDEVAGDVIFNRVGDSSYADICAFPDLPETPCAAGVPCNELSGNVNEDSLANPTDGAAILIQTTGELMADRVTLHDNRGAHAIRIVDGDDQIPNHAALHNTLLVRNAATQALVDVGPDASDSSQLIVDKCTIADNAIGDGYVVHAAVNFAEITNSIVDQPGWQTIDFSGPAGDLTAAYVLTTNASTLPGGTYVVDGEPTFADSTNGDYHLQRSSIGVDAAPDQDGIDRDGNPRTVDLIDIPSGPGGSMDLGAYEIQNQIASCAVGDTIYCDGFDSA